MQATLRLFILVLAMAFTSTAAFGDPVLKTGDRWSFGSPRAVALDTANNLVFMGRGNVLTVLNAGLTAQGSIDLDAEILCISYAANHVYAALGSKGLAAVDVSNPALLSVESTFTPADGSSVASVFASGDYAYITNIGNRFKIVNVSNPANPTQAGAETLSGLLVSAVNVSVTGNVAAVVDQVNGLHLIDVSTKSNPQWESVTGIAGAYDVRLDGAYAYVASIAGGLDIVDYGAAGTINNPQLRGGYTPTGGYSVAVFTDGNTAWLADQANGLHVIDVSDRNNPALSSTIAGTAGAYSAAVYDGYTYVCDYTAGLQRVSGGAAAFDPPADAQDLFVDADDYLYVIDNGGGTPAGDGLRILDAFHAGNVGYLGFVATPGQAHGVFASGDYAYVADGGSGLQIIDIGDRSNPAIVGSRDTAGSAQAVHVAGNYAYVADLAAGLQVIDIIDKTNPGNQVDANEATGDAAYGVTVSGSHAYVADGSAGLQVINVSNAADPAIVGTCDTPSSARDVFVSGTIAYVADSTSGLQVIDVSDPVSPLIVGSYDTGNANGVFVNGGTAYIADVENGLVSLDVSDPTSPELIDDWSTGTLAAAIRLHMAGGFVYVAEGFGGAAIYQPTDEDPFVPTPPPGSGGGGGCFIASLIF